MLNETCIVSQSNYSNEHDPNSLVSSPVSSKQTVLIESDTSRMICQLDYKATREHLTNSTISR